MIRGCVIALCVLLIFSAARAEDPARETPEYQLLETALFQLNAGVGAEDVQVIKAFLYSEGDPQLKLVEAHARRIVASGRFFKEANAVFRAKAAAQLRARYRMVNGADFGMGLLAPKWEIHGETARPVAEEAAILARNEIVLPPVINRRGIWKVNVSPTPAPGAATVEDLAAAIERHAKIVDDVASAIAARKLKTVEEVEAALKALPRFGPSQYTPDVVLSFPGGGKGSDTNADAGKL